MKTQVINLGLTTDELITLGGLVMGKIRDLQKLDLACDEADQGLVKWNDDLKQIANKLVNYLNEN